MENFYYIETIKKISNGQRKLLNSLMNSYDVTYIQALILGYLTEEPKEHDEDFEITQKDIESYMSLSAATITDVLKRMEASGYIKRVKSKKDGRANQLLPTEKGIACVPGFIEISEQVENKITEGLTKDEKKQLKTMLMKIEKNLE